MLSNTEWSLRKNVKQRNKNFKGSRDMAGNINRTHHSIFFLDFLCFSLPFFFFFSMSVQKVMCIKKIKEEAKTGTGTSLG